MGSDPNAVSQAELGSDPDFYLRAYLARKALIASILSCGSPGTGCVPTTRFIHSMFSCMRATTAGHSFAV